MKVVVNPPLMIIGMPGQTLPARPPLIGFTMKDPAGVEMSILFDADHAELFIADLISALRKMTGVIKPTADA